MLFHVSTLFTVVPAAYSVALPLTPSHLVYFLPLGLGLVSPSYAQSLQVD